MTKKLPNIVFFFTDDQRFDTICALGNGAIQTPHLDQLVEEGCSFTQAHIPSGTSAAVCMPSRAMLNTGRTLYHLEGSGQSIPLDHTTLGQALRSNGYRTFGTGKWHNGRESFNRSFSDGDEIFFGGMSDHWNVPAYHYDPTGKYDTQLPIIRNPGQSREVTYRQCDHINSGQHSSQSVCNAAIDFIESHEGDVPFYSYISFLAPHDPRSMPQEFLEMYDPDEIELPPNFLGGHPFDTGHLNIRDEMLASFPRRPEEVRQHLAEYYAMITHLDHELGRVIETLKKKGIYEDTILVFAGDNGLALGQHGLFGKQNCYEHSVRVPLIFAGPGVPQGKQTEAYAYLMDIFPTLCDLTGISIPESVESKSLLPAITGDDRIRDGLFFGYETFQRAYKDRQFKLIEYVVDGKHIQTQLFDLKNDPWEMTNLAEAADCQDKVSTMRQSLIASAEAWDDPEHDKGKPFWDSYPFQSSKVGE
ncbi:sulfatase-like hydrolase/transferase [Puniceicoccus vermicola]|uniref:Sulfatase-like hydrolase/transferase n=1 Tax=Puniceicoccus vermicola TaxID=388746 RepID=A0A7X1AZB0_9BACT|nr:sulfatase-like hydrolase/transferase [Puniceicoccus vermicola]MBC2602741.1 sulfatase-like hydrolase/transferase [Puniceicoccus vermicola]